MRIRWLYRSRSSRKTDKPSTAGCVAEEGKDSENGNWLGTAMRTILEFLFMTFLATILLFVLRSLNKNSKVDETARLNTRCIEPSFKKYQIDFKIPIILAGDEMVGWTVSGSYVYQKFYMGTELRSQKLTLRERPAKNLMMIPWSIAYGDHRPTHYILNADWTLTLPDNSTKFLKQRYHVSCDLYRIEKEMRGYV